MFPENVLNVFGIILLTVGGESSKIFIKKTHVFFKVYTNNNNNFNRYTCSPRGR